MKALLLLLTMAGVALAQPTCSGTLASIHPDRIEVLDGSGHRWIGYFSRDFQNRTGASLTQLKGQKLVYRVRGALGPEREVELVGRLADSASFQSSGVNQPYYTRKGDMAGPGGVGGTPDNGPNLAKVRNVGAGAPLGAFPHQNMP